MIPTNFKIAIATGLAVLWSAAVTFLPASQVILGLCGSALLVAVLFFWNSLRTLGGDTDIPDEAPRGREQGPLEALIARKKMLLLSLKDLENERKIGKILQEDFEEVSLRYREEVKDLMRQIDAAAAPYRSRAEELAEKHLREQGLMPKDDEKATARGTDEANATAVKGSRDADLGDADESDDGQDEVDEAASTKRYSDSKTKAPKDAKKAGETAERAEASKTVETATIPTQKSLDLESQNALKRRACPSCNASNEPDAKFCKECATPLRAKDEAPHKAEGATDA
jgi:ribosomal protein L40E